MSDSKPTNPKDMIASGKLPLHLVPDTLEAAAAIAFLEGALKYGAYNWRVAGVRSSVYYSALKRHMKKWWNGQDDDPDTGVPHLWNAVACLAILIDAAEAGKLTDDRAPRIDMDSMITRLNDLTVLIKQKFEREGVHHFTIADSQEKT